MCLLSHPGLSPCFCHCSLQCSGVSSVPRPGDRTSLGSPSQAYRPDVVQAPNLQPGAGVWFPVCFIPGRFLASGQVNTFIICAAVFVPGSLVTSGAKTPFHPSFPGSEPCAREQSRCSISTVLLRELSLSKVIHPLLKLWTGGFVCKVLSQISRILSKHAKVQKAGYDSLSL